MTVNANNLLIRKFQSQLHERLLTGHETKPTYQRYLIAGHMSENGYDQEILNFLNGVTADLDYPLPQCQLKAIVLFQGPDIVNQAVFDQLLLQRMIALQQLDYKSANAQQGTSQFFSTGLVVPLRNKQFYVTGLHPTHRLRALRFPFPSLVFDTEPGMARHTARLDEDYQQCLS